MGTMRFLIPAADVDAENPELFRAFVRGPDGRIHPTHVTIEGTQICCSRPVSESGKVHISWPVKGFGTPPLSTCSLQERDEPYVLLVELARGKILQTRDQAGNWEIAGMIIPDEFKAASQQAHRHLMLAASMQDDVEQSTAEAGQALEFAFRAAELLAQSYAEQRLAVRRAKSQHIPASLGCYLGRGEPQANWHELFPQAFSTVHVPVEWKLIEQNEGEYDFTTNDAQMAWCQDQKLIVWGGPLLDLSPNGLPPWVWQWQHDFPNFQSLACSFVESALSRYVGRVRHWEISSSVNTGGGLALNEENRLSLVAKTLETARQIDDEIQLQIRVDEPWGEYQARGNHRLTPLQFVDALARSNVGLSAVNLEIAVGYRPRGCAFHDGLDLSALLDQWSGLGIPLYVTLSFPSAADEDTLADRDLEVDPNFSESDRGEEAQANWLASNLPILLSKQTVIGIFWTHFSDAIQHDYPHSGMLDSTGNPKPIFHQLVDYQQKYWAATE